jgi:hypothetical protein
MGYEPGGFSNLGASAHDEYLAAGSSIQEFGWCGFGGPAGSLRRFLAEQCRIVAKYNPASGNSSVHYAKCESLQLIGRSGLPRGALALLGLRAHALSFGRQ